MKFTHEGQIFGNDLRAPSYRRRVFLRETKNFFIADIGIKFKKTNGSGIGELPLFSLDLKTLKKIGDL